MLTCGVNRKIAPAEGRCYLPQTFNYTWKGGLL